MGGDRTSVIVVGAGVIGCASAYELAAAGCRVQVLDRGGLGQEASWASAGMVSQTFPGDDPLSRFHALGEAMFPELAATISDLTGVDSSYRMNGGFRVCLDPAEWPEWEAAYGRLRGQGLPCERLFPGELVEREPALSSDTAGGLYLPRDGLVDPRQFTRVLALAAQRRGAAFHLGRPVTGFLRDGARVTGVETPLGRLHADATVVATGAWTEGVGQTLGVDLPMKPARGQIVQFASMPPALTHTVHCGDFYLTARPDGTVLAGSTVEFAGFDKQVTADGVKRLLDQMLRVAPGLAELPMTGCWAGLRPYPERDLPYLGPVPGLEGLFIAAGHFRTGIKPAPITGRLVAEWITGQPPSIPLEPFAIGESGSTS